MDFVIQMQTACASASQISDSYLARMTLQTTHVDENRGFAPEKVECISRNGGGGDAIKATNNSEYFAVTETVGMICAL
jgi:hypothetical protein